MKISHFCLIQISTKALKKTQDSLIIPYVIIYYKNCFKGEEVNNGKSTYTR